MKFARLWRDGRKETPSLPARQPKVCGVSGTISRAGLHKLLNEEVIVEASHLAETYALRGYDAVQLAAAVKANNERILSGLPPLIIVSADTELNDAALTEGFHVENPNNHP